MVRREFTGARDRGVIGVTGAGASVRFGFGRLVHVHLHLKTNVAGAVRPLAALAPGRPKTPTRQFSACSAAFLHRNALAEQGGIPLKLFRERR